MTSTAHDLMLGIMRNLASSGAHHYPTLANWMGLEPNDIEALFNLTDDCWPPGENTTWRMYLHFCGWLDKRPQASAKFSALLEEESARRGGVDGQYPVFCELIRQFGCEPVLGAKHTFGLVSQTFSAGDLCRLESEDWSATVYIASVEPHWLDVFGDGSKRVVTSERFSMRAMAGAGTVSMTHCMQSAEEALPTKHEERLYADADKAAKLSARGVTAADFLRMADFALPGVGMKRVHVA